MTPSETPAGCDVLLTPRLILRPFVDQDASRLELLINDKSIAAQTLSIPYPYPVGAGREWIEESRKSEQEGRAANRAICLASPTGVSSDEPAARTTDSANHAGLLIGCAGLVINHEHQRAELGYWIGREYRGRGYCTEAVEALMDYGFDQLALHRIHAHHLARNPASGRVLEKAGMQREGRLPGHIRKWGTFEDVIAYGVLHSDR